MLPLTRRRVLEVVSVFVRMFHFSRRRHVVVGDGRAAARDNGNVFRGDGSTEDGGARQATGGNEHLSKHGRLVTDWKIIILKWCNCERVKNVTV